MSELTIEHHPCTVVPQAVEVVVKGKMSPLTVTQFKTTVDGLLAGPVSILLLGLKDVGFLPSITLSYLADLYARLDRRGGAIVLVHAESAVKIVLTQLGLVPFFKFCDSFDAARSVAGECVVAARRKPRLLLFKGPGQGVEFVIDAEPLIIGSDPSVAIHMKVPRLASKHAEVALRGDHVYVRDLGSASGTWVNGEKAGAEPLRSGDTLIVQECEFRFLGRDEAPPK